MLLSPDQSDRSGVLARIADAVVHRGARGALRRRTSRSLRDDRRPALLLQSAHRARSCIDRAGAPQAATVSCAATCSRRITLLMIVALSAVLVVFTMILPALPYRASDVGRPGAGRNVLLSADRTRLHVRRDRIDPADFDIPRPSGLWACHRIVRDHPVDRCRRLLSERMPLSSNVEDCCLGRRARHLSRSAAVLASGRDCGVRRRRAAPAHIGVACGRRAVRES